MGGFMKKETTPQMTPLTICFKDLYISAYLKAKGFPLFNADLDERGRTVFHFTEIPELQKALMQYYANTALVSPSVFIESFKSLRAQAYSLSDKKNMEGKR